ncbi:TMV resistance protein N-like [Benincasa hispida]|uniref:TMV resistance protein N-like n=1 Tax=Benincasa hispida TaxID=102211 RepID=UPI0018FFEE1D|nr:TMV resistance protein N-like [Benincasa hispida]
MKSFDTFINFRGEDVRNNLIGHLFDALHNYGLITIFLDNEELLIGDRLDEMLEKSIEESRTAIVVLSKNYADSKWCLRELVKIMETMDDGTNRVLPVFYHVDPSDVRRQSGCFRERFDEYDQINDPLQRQEVNNWRTTLTKVGNLAGVVVTGESPQVHGLNKITNQIFDMLRRPMLVDPNKLKYLVDIPNRLSDINSLLDFESKEVRFIGIVGMGGIGKSTLAQVIYDKFASTFGNNNSCFLTVSGRDIVTVQRLLLSKLVYLRRNDGIKISEESEGANMIKNCLSRQKVLIVLDGVNEKEQLENLAGSFDWFGSKSRIIITTRNKDVFSHRNHQQVQIYNVEPLDYKSSFSLFWKHAFGESGGPNEEQFIQFSKEIVEKVEGHPLALEQIGASLHGRDINVWREELESVILVENKRLFNILKISFDQLERKSQQAFLDLACFFHGKSKDKVIEILESFGYTRPYTELQLMCNRFLIEMDNEGIIYIHNLIQAMGQKIERQEPQRARIWFREDAFDIFAEQHGVKYIKGVVLDKREKQPELELEPSLFKEMTSLKLLEIDNVKLTKNLEYLSKQLRSLNWHGYPSNSLPQNFEAPRLFELLLPRARTSHLWNGVKRFEKLKVIDASDSHNLVETPNLSQVPNLERLVLCDCTRLRTIDNSIISLNRLVLLDLKRCISLKTFTLMGRLRSRTVIELDGSGLEGRPILEGEAVI